MAHQGRQNIDDSLAAALAAGKTLRDASTDLGISERTAGRRWAKAEFRAKVTALRGEMVGRAMGQMADAMADATATLRALLKAESEAVRLGAARSICEITCRLRDSTETNQRIEELEQAVAALTEKVIAAARVQNFGGHNAA